MHAAIGQEIGVIAPQENKCNRCRLYKGTFKSCVVFAYNLTGSPQLMYNGACMNCRIIGKACSFSMDLPRCVLLYGRANCVQLDKTQSHPQLGSSKFSKLCHIVLLPRYSCQISSTGNERLLFVIPRNLLSHTWECNKWVAY